MQEKAAVRWLQAALIAFFSLSALILVVGYALEPSLYTQTLLMQTPNPDAHPLWLSAFVLAILAFIVVVMYGVLHRWRWLFWLLLVAFSASILEFPVTALQLGGIIPNAPPLGYALLRLASAGIEIAFAVWMLRLYRRAGVWGLGR